MKTYDEFINENLSTIPYDLSKISTENRDKEILRSGIIAELDAINLYEQMSELADNKKIKKVLLDVAREEKTHVGEFQSLLEEIDKEYEKELKIGKDEVDEL